MDSLMAIIIALTVMFLTTTLTAAIREIIFPISLLDTGKARGTQVSRGTFTLVREKHLRVVHLEQEVARLGASEQRFRQRIKDLRGTLDSAHLLWDARSQDQEHRWQKGQKLMSALRARYDAMVKQKDMLLQEMEAEVKGLRKQIARLQREQAAEIDNKPTGSRTQLNAPRSQGVVRDDLAKELLPRVASRPPVRMSLRHIARSQPRIPTDTELQSEVSRLSEVNDKKQAELDRLTAELVASRADQDKLHGTVSALESEITKLQKANASLEEERKNLQVAAAESANQRVASTPVLSRSAIFTVALEEPQDPTLLFPSPPASNVNEDLARQFTEYRQRVVHLATRLRGTITTLLSSPGPVTDLGNILQHIPQGDEETQTLEGLEACADALCGVVARLLKSPREICNGLITSVTSPLEEFGELLRAIAPEESRMIGEKLNAFKTAVVEEQTNFDVAPTVNGTKQFVTDILRLIAGKLTSFKAEGEALALRASIPVMDGDFMATCFKAMEEFRTFLKSGFANQPRLVEQLLRQYDIFADAYKKGDAGVAPQIITHVLKVVLSSVTSKWSEATQELWAAEQSRKESERLTSQLRDVRVGVDKNLDYMRGWVKEHIPEHLEAFNFRIQGRAGTVSESEKVLHLMSASSKFLMSQLLNLLRRGAADAELSGTEILKELLALAKQNISDEGVVERMTGFINRVSQAPEMPLLMKHLNCTREIAISLTNALIAAEAKANVQGAPASSSAVLTTGDAEIAAQSARFQSLVAEIDKYVRSNDECYTELFRMHTNDDALKDAASPLQRNTLIFNNSVTFFTEWVTQVNYLYNKTLGAAMGKAAEDIDDIDFSSMPSNSDRNVATIRGRMASKTCEHCGKTGHSKNFCPEIQRCARCGLKRTTQDHIAARCPHRSLFDHWLNLLIPLVDPQFTTSLDDDRVKYYQQLFADKINAMNRDTVERVAEGLDPELDQPEDVFGTEMMKVWEELGGLDPELANLDFS